MHSSIGTIANTDAIFGNDQEFCLQALSQSMIVTELEVETFVARPLDYDDLVDQGKALHGNDIARFHCPDLDDLRMMWGSAEYFRWYSADGKKRTAPLDYDELVQLVMFRDECSLEDAEHEVSLNSRAKVGDKSMWKLAVELGMVDYAELFAVEYSA